jgi:voltage-gated potassium channel
MIPFFWVLIRFVRTFWHALKDPEFQALFFLVVVTLVSGAWFYSKVEGWSLLDSFYFSVITLTTVGYGDFSPHTAAGKIFTIFYILIGIGIILGFVNAVAERSMKERRGILGRRRRPKEAGTKEAETEEADDR